MRTTVDIDAPILRKVRALQAREGKSLGWLISHMLARALEWEPGRPATSRPEWFVKPMRARVDLQDKETLHQALDE